MLVGEAAHSVPVGRKVLASRARQFFASAEGLAVAVPLPPVRRKRKAGRSPVCNRPRQKERRLFARFRGDVKLARVGRNTARALRQSASVARGGQPRAPQAPGQPFAVRCSPHRLRCGLFTSQVPSGGMIASPIGTTEAASSRVLPPDETPFTYGPTAADVTWDGAAPTLTVEAAGRS